MIDFKVPSEGYGPLKAGMDIKIPEGFVTIIGENNVGKTAALQLVFRKIFGDGNQDNICFIPKYRDFILSSTTSDQNSLKTINHQIAVHFGEKKLDHSAYQSIWQVLFSTLAKEFDVGEQSQKIKQTILELRFGAYRNGEGGRSFLDNIPLHFHGSGARSIMPIVAAITCEKIKYILIDEPEAGLEAGKQKQLKKLLQQCAKAGKNIIVTTHSHLFLNDEAPENNLKMIKGIDDVILEPVVDRAGLSNIAFKMLGSSLSDLYLPDNFLLVEGAADQVLCEKVAKLLKEEAGNEFNLRIISCGGIQDIEPTQRSMEHVFLPIIEGKSPYAKIAVSLIDKPEGKDSENIATELRRTLNSDGRYFELSETSLEKYIPEALYAEAGMEKAVEIVRVEEAGDYKEKAKVKKEISKKISDILRFEDLESIFKIRDAVLKAMCKNKEVEK